MKTKKQLITENIISTAKGLSREPLTAKQVENLTGFIARRLDTHGQHGYMFQASIDYKKQLISPNLVEELAVYSLQSNHIKIDMPIY